VILEAVRAIQRANYILITAGAGIGVDSGLPDFRGVEGFWRAYPVAKKLGLRFEELANPRWFKENPKLAWAFYGHRLNLYRKTKPHLGFSQLLEIAKSKKDYFVFTSNVDGQFQKANFSPDKIEEVHGSIHYLQCTHPCKEEVWSAKDVEVKVDLEKFEALEPLPRCIFCNSLARPNILMFNDWEFVEKRRVYQEELFNDFLNRASLGKLVIIEIGAGTAVPTVRVTGERIAKLLNAKLIRINPKEAWGADISIPLGAKEAIEKIYRELGF